MMMNDDGATTDGRSVKTEGRSLQMTMMCDDEARQMAGRCVEPHTVGVLNEDDATTDGRSVKTEGWNFTETE